MLSDGQAGATLPVKDLERARKFYGETLGFSALQDGQGGILFQGGQGTAFFVYASEFAGTNKATAMAVNVVDFEATVADLRAKGITFIDYDQPEFKTENGVAMTPEGAAAWFPDPDGNILSVTSMGSAS
jgi:catechol 2,3-dioxygenase-like lactoylglutathione lyase family enzyme